MPILKGNSWWKGGEREMLRISDLEKLTLKLLKQANHLNFAITEGVSEVQKQVICKEGEFGGVWSYCKPCNIWVGIQRHRYHVP